MASREKYHRVAQRRHRVAQRILGALVAKVGEGRGEGRGRGRGKERIPYAHLKLLVILGALVSWWQK
jgi:hypothetical protein